MRKKLRITGMASVVFLFSSFFAFAQNCPLLTHNSFTDFNATPKPPTATSLWLNIHTKLDNNDLINNGDFLLYKGGTISLNGISSTPSVSNLALPNGVIVADNTVSKPVTSYDMGSNTWTTRVPPGFSSSDIFISGAVISSSTGFSITGNKSSTITGMFFSNRPSFKQAWFYGIAAYQPPFSYSSIASPGQVTSIGGGVQAGTPLPEKAFLVAGGTGGGGSNFTGSYSSTDNFSTCQKAGCSLSGAVQSTDVTCNGAANGSVTVTLTGGTAPYTYTTPDGSIFFYNANTVNTFNNFPPGTYPFTVTDAAGCKVNLSASISQPAPLQATGIVVNGTNNLTNGSISVTVSGGTPPYSFLWSTGAQTQNLSGLGAGSYTLTVTDANGCTAGLTELLTGQTCTSLPVTATVLRGDFNNSCDGEASIDVTGGTAPFTYAWSDGVTTTTNTRVDLCGPPAGSGTPVQYTVVVTDANGCSGSTSFLIDVSSSAPSNITGIAQSGMGIQFGGVNGANGAYPNPSNGLVHVQINAQERTNAVINLVDLTGRVIKSYVMPLEKGLNSKDLQMPNHAGGVYMLQVKTSKEAHTVKILLN